MRRLGGQPSEQRWENCWLRAILKSGGLLAAGGLLARDVPATCRRAEDSDLRVCARNFRPPGAADR